MFRKPTQQDSSHSRLSRRAFSAITVAAGLAVSLAMPAHAEVLPGDQFVYEWTELSPDPGLTGTADITIGDPNTTIASFAIFQNGGFCGVCTPLSEDLSGVSFDPATLGVTGHVTGSFQDQANGVHTFDLATELGGTWIFDEVDPTGLEETSTGTYVVVVKTVDEPSVLGLLGLAFAALAGFRPRRSA
jgi:hypothetical protein